MPPLRFPRRSLFWFVVLFLGMLLALPAVPLLGSLSFMIEPRLQRYYLSAYLVSAKVFHQSSATTPVIWLYKTAPGRRRVLLTERDVESANSGTLGLRLSPAALADGWTGIQAGAQERMDSADLHAFLQANIYDGHSSVWVLAEPLLLGFLGVAGLFAVVIAIRRRSKLSRRQRGAAWKADQGSGAGFARGVECQAPARWNSAPIAPGHPASPNSRASPGPPTSRPRDSPKPGIEPHPANG